MSEDFQKYRFTCSFYTPPHANSLWYCYAQEGDWIAQTTGKELRETFEALLELVEEMKENE